MRCWNCDAQLRPGAQICPNCHADQNVAYGDWDESLPIPVRRPEPTRRRERDARPARDDSADYAAFDDRTIRAERSGGRGDRRDRGGRYDAPSRDPHERHDRSSYDDYDDYDEGAASEEYEAERGGEYAGRPARGGRDGRSERDERDERDERASRSSRPDYDHEDERPDRVERQGRENSSRRGRSTGDGHEEREERNRRSGRGGRHSSLPPVEEASAEYAAYADDSRESSAYTDESLETPARQPERTPDRAGEHREARDQHDQRDQQGGRTPPSRGRLTPDYRRDGAPDAAYAGSADHLDQPDQGGVRSGGRSRLSSNQDRSPGRGEPRDSRLPDPLDDPRAPRPLRTSRPLRDQRDRDPHSGGGRGGPGGPSLPGGGSPGIASPGRPRSRADYPEYGPNAGMPGSVGARRDPRDRSLPGPYPSRGGPSGGRMAGSLGGMSQGFEPGAPPGRMLQNDPWSPAATFNPPGALPGQRRGQPARLEPDATQKPALNRTRLIAVVLLVALGLAAIAGASYHFAPISIKGKIKHLLGVSTTASTPTPPPFATYTPGPTPTTPPNDKSNNSASARYIIDYPATWQFAAQNTTSSGQYDLLDTYTA
ncbi:MAG TPA: zinc ribbon domain-containing protein, partial [Ktedonobacterales bacterium]|nr:zinc ribbon domain-containing protein [Ktedonobacterales bacterium]